MKKRIIIAEDCDLFGMILLYRLEKDGYEVKVFDNGEKAATYMSKNKFDLLITDLQMPVMNGLELIQLVRKSISTSIPIIVISSTCEEKDKLKILKMGGDLYVSKPVMAGELSVRVKAMI